MAHDKRTRQKLEAELAVLLKKGRLQRAAVVLRTILEKDPDDDRLHIKLADVSQKLGDEAGVRAAFRGAASAAEKKGFYLRAMASLRQLARYLPPPERPWTELADLALRLGLVGDALGFLDEGIRAWEAVGDRPAMLAANRQAHALAPDDVHRTLRLTLELRAAGRKDEALSLLAGEAARHLEAGRPEAWLALAAERSSLTPSDRALACEVAAAYLERGEPRQALRRLQSLLRERAQHVESLRLLVRTFEALQQPSKRLAALRELARTLASRGREAEARLLWRELQQALPADPEAGRALGQGPTLGPAAVARPPVAVPVAVPVPAPPPPPDQPLEPIEAARAPADEPEEELIDLAGEGVEVEEEAPGATPPPPPQPARPAPPPALHFSATPPPGSPLLAAVDLSLLEPDPEPPAPGALPEDFEDDLAHADFLVAHRFGEEARELLASLESASPGNAGVAALRARLEAGPERIPPHPAAASSALAGSAPATTTPSSAPAGPAAPAPEPRPAPPPPLGGQGAVLDADDLGAVELISAGEVLARFREQVALTVAPDDAATHYDLGIAYREMGLVTEALAEFELALPAAKGPRAIDCLVGLALCEAARGEPGRAARALKRALLHEALTPPAAAAVLYELGVLRERAGDGPGAAWAFDASERAQPRLRDAADRAGRLRAAGAAPPPAAAQGQRLA